MPPKAGPAKKPRTRKVHVMPPPVPVGEVFTDNYKKKWRIGEPIGSGGFGLLYLASKHEERNDRFVIKVEPHSNGPLFCELNFYTRVCKPELITMWMREHKTKSLAIPKYVSSGSHERSGAKYRFMVMERYGPDLQKIFEHNGKQFPLKVVFQLAIRLIDALEYIHDHGYVHADIKASNILTGYPSSSNTQVFLVDYGLACRFSLDDKHKAYVENPERTHDGTIEFTSRDAHRGVIPSRRGDLEILGYCLLQWISGKLPWEHNLVDKDYVASQKFKLCKDPASLIHACFPKNDGPAVLTEYTNYVMRLAYNECPKYELLRQWFKAALKKHGFPNDAKLVFEMKTRKVLRTKLGPVKRAASGESTSSEGATTPPKRAKMVSPSSPKTSPVKATKSSPSKRLKASPAKRPKVTPGKRQKASPAKDPTTSPANRKKASSTKHPKISPTKRKKASPANRKGASPANRKGASTVNCLKASPANIPQMSSAKSPVALNVKRTKQSPSVHGSPKSLSVPPIQALSPQAKSKKSKGATKTKAKGTRVVRAVKSQANAATQTSPGLKGLRRRHKPNVMSPLASPVRKAASLHDFKTPISCRV